MRQRKTLISKTIKSRWANAIRNTVSSIPCGALGAGSRLVNTTNPIEVFPRQAFVSWIGAYALCSIVIGVRRT